MTVLSDTNVVPELIRKSSDPTVETWAAGQPLEDPFFSAVGEAELRYGAFTLPRADAGKLLDLGHRDDAWRRFQRLVAALR